MTADQSNGSFGRDLSRWLAEESEHRMPDHLAEVLVHTAATRQRPWWSSPERWLPMDTTLRPAQAPRMVWLLVLLAVALALGAVALAVGSRAPRPAPLVGLAGAGPIAYSTADGDIRAFDPASGASAPIITGGTYDIAPLFTNDGTRFLFMRRIAEPDTWTVMQAAADGSDVRPLLDTPLTQVDWLDWSTDGQRAVIQAKRDGVSVVLVVDATGKTPPTIIDPGFAAGGYTWRSDADELVFQGSNDPAGRPGLYGIRPDGTGLRTIVDGTPGYVIDPALSPDGSRIAYATIVGQDHAELRIVDVDTGTVTAPVFDGTLDDYQVGWSPDGTRLSLVRHSLGSQCQVGVAPATGGHVTTLGPVAPTAGGCVDVQWAPDGRDLVAYYPFNQTTWRLDPAGGLGTKLDIPGKDLNVSWQRLPD